jgi:hypothetical protein
MNLSKVYHVLGEDGYRLHRDITDLERGSSESAGNINNFSPSTTFRFTNFLEYLIDFSENLMPSSGHNSESYLECSNPSRTSSAATGNKETSKDSCCAAAKEESESIKPGFSTNLIHLRDERVAAGISESSKVGERQLIDDDDDDENRVNSSSFNPHTEDIFLMLIEYGSRMASINPRDVPCFYCLFSLLMFLLEKDRFKKLPSYANPNLKSKTILLMSVKKCLLRCLAISSQATSAGVIGWFEYGLSQDLNLAFERPLTLLHGLACSFALENSWYCVEDVLQALLLKCEQWLPKYHPITLLSLLDLAGAAFMNGNKNFARKLLSDLSSRLSIYLTKMEGLCTSKLGEHLSREDSEQQRQAGFVMHNGQDAMSMLRDFISLLQSNSRRLFLSTLGQTNEISFINDIIIADSLAVEANCHSMTETFFAHSYKNEAPTQKVDSRSCTTWRKALAHYRLAFQGFSQVNGLDHSSTLFACCGIARCLRELGEPKKAFKMLFFATDQVGLAIHRTEDEMIRNFRRPVLGGVLYFQGMCGRDKMKTSYQFLAGIFEPNLEVENKSMAMGFCNWLLAMLSAELYPTYEGTTPALRLLLLSSQSFTSALRLIANENELARNTCVNRLRMVEEEARQLVEVLKNARSL